MKIHIRGGRLIDPKSNTDAQRDLYLAAGKVVAVGHAPAEFHANKVIDASGKIVCPGLVDIAARLREPGFEYKATLESEMAAAVAGGVTSLACLPDTDPPLDEPGLVEMLKHRARQLNQAHVYPIGALTVGLKGEQLTEMSQLLESGCVAFSHADAPIADTQVLSRALAYAATFGFAVWLRPQDSYLSKGGVAHDGEVATRLGLPAIPVVAETIALQTILTLAEKHRARVHLCRLSSAEGVALVKQAKARGVAVTCDVAVHHLHLSEVDIGYFDSHCHLIPPLRSVRDRDALRGAAQDGTIDVICSDHTPVDDDAKQVPFAEAEPGASALELLLPLTLKWAAQARVPLPQALARITCDAARVLGIDAGHLAPGHNADICIFDPSARWKVEPRSLKSQGRNTPFIGYELEGKVCLTLVDGHAIFESR